MPTAKFLTYTGQEINLQSPDPETIRLMDIAHALGNICRYNGQCSKFLSVAEHSINCALYIRGQDLGQRLELLALLHDAAEAYIGDMARPLRTVLPEFSLIEDRFMAAIYQALGVEPPDKWEQAQVAAADQAVLSSEFAVLLPGGYKYSDPGSGAGLIKFKHYPPRVAALQFMSTLADVDFPLWHRGTELNMPIRAATVREGGA